MLHQVGMMDGGQTGMGDTRSRAGSTEKPGKPRIIRPPDRVRQELHRHVAIEHPVIAEMDHAHSAAADLADEPHRAQFARYVHLGARHGRRTFPIHGNRLHRGGRARAGRWRVQRSLRFPVGFQQLHYPVSEFSISRARALNVRLAFLRCTLLDGRKKHAFFVSGVLRHRRLLHAFRRTVRNRLADHPTKQSDPPLFFRPARL